MTPDSDNAHSKHHGVSHDLRADFEPTTDPPAFSGGMNSTG